MNSQKRLEEFSHFVSKVNKLEKISDLYQDLSMHVCRFHKQVITIYTKLLKKYLI